MATSILNHINRMCEETELTTKRAHAILSALNTECNLEELPVETTMILLYTVMDDLIKVRKKIEKKHSAIKHNVYLLDEHESVYGVRPQY